MSGTRVVSGVVLGAAIALAARRAGSLDRSGAIAATVVGTIAIAAGWGWGALLIAYFAASSGLSRWRRGEKERRTGAVVAKGGERDARQVLSNGGVFGLAALAAMAWPDAMPLAGAAGAGALAASAADTWATEIGVLAGGTPRSLRGWRRVPVGTSGAVSVAGSLAMLAGAAAIALLAWALGVTAAIAAVAVAGVVGAMCDTLLGAAVQERRWCDRCDVATERRVHDCGVATRRTGGIASVDNDVVNVACTAIGAAVALVAIR